MTGTMLTSEIEELAAFSAKLDRLGNFFVEIVDVVAADPTTGRLEAVR